MNCYATETIESKLIPTGVSAFKWISIQFYSRISLSMTALSLDNANTLLSNALKFKRPSTHLGDTARARAIVLYELLLHFVKTK